MEHRVCLENRGSLNGIDAELYYVRDDVVNHYALSFILPVPSDTNSLHFTWHSSSKVDYRLGFQMENTSVMDQPQSNITVQGEVPRTRSVFRVDLFCSGKADGEAVLTVQLNLTTLTNNFTVLNFKRRKMCYRRIEQPEPPKTLPFPNTTIQRTGPSSSNAPTTSTRVFYISVCVCCIVIFLVAIILAVLHLHTIKRVEMDDSVSDSGSSQGLSQPSTQTTQYLRADTPNNATPVTNAHTGSAPILQLPSASFPHSDAPSQETKNHASEVQVTMMLTESCKLRGLHHRNLLPISHVCIEDGEKPMVLLPYMNWGNLKLFLRQCKLAEANNPQAISQQDLVHMAIQISCGMSYLARREVIHKDLAARNCVIDNSMQVKITDNALARDLFPMDYHCLGDNENRPVRWMALESLLNNDFSSASDVWAFGVTLWELMTLGQTPYVDIDPFEMAAYLKDGYRIAQPINCPDELFAVMACCWALDPEERPKFQQLVQCLTEFHAALGAYV
ncbi:tyrosine-protein kinase RYK precursor [Triplophysa rosa]|uniref:receptor protein-tyrosine kinase n=1 Tax=Triplophysa rosa TaxID=992332 RepID=A0A9W7W7Y0_TRIRA|nr:tyrosine-protein kinase RYK precursor [Triplophysa rosa]